MRFIHIADVHLGARPDAGPLYSEGRARELWETFEHVLGVCEEEQTDLLLIAGDLFHRQPLVRELKEADYLFSELTHTKVVLIAGNHDYIGKNSNYRTFRWSENVYPSRAIMTISGRIPITGRSGGMRMCIRSSGRRCSMRISRSLTRRCTA